MDATPSPSTRPVSRLAAFAAALTGRAVFVAVAHGVAAAVALNGVFVTPFPILLGRMLFLAIVLLMVYAAVGVCELRWLPRWLPRWGAQVGAVVLVAPLGTLVVYTAWLGSPAEVFARPETAAGFVWIAGTAVAIGVVVSLGAQVREREAQAEAARLQFELAREQLERQIVSDRMARLQAQVEPHFLFNTLANVQALVEQGSPRAAPVLANLVAYLRAAVPRLNAADATLADEAALVRAYLELMHLRMPDRLHWRLDIPPALAGEPFAPMVLLTLVENAVRHGIDPSEQGGTIEVGARRDGEALVAWVADTGVGMAESAQPGTGLVNLRERLATLHGGRARLDLLAVEPHGLRAEIRIGGSPA